MAVIAKGILASLKEKHYDTAKGPQCDLMGALQQTGQSAEYVKGAKDNPTSCIISYKVASLAKELVGKPVEVVLFIRARAEDWHEIIILSIAEAKAV